MADRIPLIVGQDIETTIDGLAFGGDGVGRIDGVPVFIPDVVPDERVTARVVEVKKRFARGELTGLAAASPYRTLPPCPIYGTCGGCQLQHLQYAAACSAKTQMVVDNLTRLGHLRGIPVAETVPSPLPYGYRNKVELECRRGDDGGVELCYHQRDPRDLVAVENCPIALPEVNALIEEIGYWLTATGWPIFDEETAEGLVREVAIRYSVSTREANLVLTTGRRDVPEKAPWIAELRKELPQIVGVRHMARTRASQTAVGKPVGEIFGRALRFQVGEMSFRAAPEVFFQVNDSMIEPMREAIAAALQPEPGDHLVDLYGGVGTFGLLLAERVKQVTILEIDPAAANDARANIKYNEVANADIVRGQVEQKLPLILKDRPADLLLVDPPRRGCSEVTLSVLAESGARRIAYVSCDPATLARDLRRLDDLGYETIHVQPFDLFPQTSQIESVATLVRRTGQ